MTETPDSSQEPGLQKLGRYEIRAELGRGGFATVYRALDPNLDREVALKVLHPQLLVDRNFVARFRKEARALANLRHAHIVTVYEVSEADGRLFIAMELAHGPSLADAVAQRGRIPWAEALDILRPVCTALDYAHSQGIVHRDLKPANILLDKERGPLLTDFGLARIMGGSSMSISISGGIVGTPAYIAPEVWEEEAARPAADIYALGCVCYEMVTGALLFNGATPMHMMRAHDKGPQFTAWPEGTPPGLDAALRSALAAAPGARYPSSEAFWHALNDAEANAQAAREQAEREAVAAQWQAEVEQAIAEGEWSIAKKAVGRWLKITPESEAAQAARRRIEGQEAKEQEEARRKKQEEAERKAREEQESKRKRQEEEAAQKTREEQEREAARIAAEQAESERKARLQAKADRQAREAQEREAARVAAEEAQSKAQAEAAAKATAQLTQLNTQLQVATAQKAWGEVQHIAGQIQTLRPEDANAAKWITYAQAQMAEATAHKSREEHEREVARLAAIKQAHGDVAYKAQAPVGAKEAIRQIPIQQTKPKNSTKKKTLTGCLIVGGIVLSIIAIIIVLFLLTNWDNIMWELGICVSVCVSLKRLR